MNTDGFHVPRIKNAMGTWREDSPGAHRLKEEELEAFASGVCYSASVAALSSSRLLSV